MPTGVRAGVGSRASAAGFGEAALSAIVAILLGVFWLGVLVTVGFTAWRLLANLKSLAASVAELSRQLTPALEELSDASQQTAELAARLQERQAAWQESARPGARPAGRAARTGARPPARTGRSKVDSDRTSAPRQARQGRAK